MKTRRVDFLLVTELSDVFAVSAFGMPCRTVCCFAGGHYVTWQMSMEQLIVTSRDDQCLYRMSGQSFPFLPNSSKVATHNIVVELWTTSMHVVPGLNPTETDVAVAVVS